VATPVEAFLCWTVLTMGSNWQQQRRKILDGTSIRAVNVEVLEETFAKAFHSRGSDEVSGLPALLAAA